MKQDPISDKIHPSTSPSHATHRQTVPVQDEIEAPPPYTPSTSTSVPQRTPISPVSARSSQSSDAGENAPLQRRRSAGSDGYARDDGIAMNGIPESGDQGYAPPAPMSSELNKEPDWDSQPGCCFSSTGGCCFSDHGGCLFSSYGGCCFSSHGGCCVSDNGGCCFSDNGGCCFGDNGGACFSDGIVSHQFPPLER